MWPFLQAILTNPNFVSFIVSIGAGATWDTIKWMGSDSPQEKDYGPLALDMLSHVFMQFYQVKEMDYNESEVMDSLLNAIKSERLQQVTDVSREVVSIITGSDLTDEDYADWQQCFIQVCSKEEYQVIWRSIVLSETLSKPQKEHGAWAKNRFTDNYCFINLHVIDQAIPELSKIDYSLDRYSWIDLEMLVWELLYNAQKHGGANKCRLLITSDSISVYDNGIEFNQLDLLDQELVGGGGLALSFFKDSYPNISLSYELKTGENTICIKYPNAVFNIYSLCEIEITNLIRPEDTIDSLPNGPYKYCFIDFEKHFDEHGFRGMPISGMVSTYRLMSRVIENKTCEKLYLHFPDTDDGLYLYKNMKRVQIAQTFLIKHINKIVLLRPTVKA